MLEYLNTSEITASLLHEIADSYAEAYSIDPDDIEIVSRHRIADNISDMPVDFLYWVYVVAILEDIIDDEDGWRCDDYVHDAVALERMFGHPSSIRSAPAALAYARTQMLLSTPTNTVGWLDGSVLEHEVSMLLDGIEDWDAIEAMAKLDQMLWRNWNV